MRLASLHQSLRGAFARRGREAVAWLAIGGTLAAMLFTAQQVLREWDQRRVAAERAVRDQLTTAAVLIGTEAAKMSALELRALLWPVLGRNESPNARPLTIDEFARAGPGIFAVMDNDRGAVGPGYFRLDLTDVGNPAAQLSGALATDTMYARAELDEVRQWKGRMNLDRPDVRIVGLRPQVRSLPMVMKRDVRLP